MPAVPIVTLRRLTITLSESTQGITSKEIKVIEKPKSYKCAETNKNIVHKSKMLKIHSLLRNELYNDSPVLKYHIYCKEEDLCEAEHLLKETIRDRVSELNQGMNKLIDNLYKI